MHEENDGSNQSVNVTIFGVEYKIVGDMDQEYYKELAKYVDERMWEISESSNIVSSTKVAVLAALNIANELFLERETQKGDIEKIEKKTSRLISILDKYI
jgi:cell division protein ZapA